MTEAAQNYHQLLQFLETPPLWKEKELFDMRQFELPEKIPLSQVEVPHIPEKTVFGKRMELFFKASVEKSESMDVLEANLQIRKENKSTIGELDFLLKDKANKKFFHVELCYKFYVYDPEIKEELARWIGPNRRDTLLKKIKRLREKQFPLLFSGHTAKALKHHQLKAEEFEQEVCFKASLFVPQDLYHKTLPFINNECISGCWYRKNEMVDNHRRGDLYALPSKPEWITDPANFPEWIYLETLLPKLDEKLFNNRSIYCVKKKPTGKYERFFIVWW